jgi:hypothetical protein
MCGGSANRRPVSAAIAPTALANRPTARRYNRTSRRLFALSSAPHSGQSRRACRHARSQWARSTRHTFFPRTYIGHAAAMHRNRYTSVWSVSTTYCCLLRLVDTTASLRDTTPDPGPGELPTHLYHVLLRPLVRSVPMVLCRRCASASTASTVTVRGVAPLQYSL